MACPYFEPAAPLDWQSWRARLRPPLGSLHSGLCHAGPEPFRPGVERLTDNCNMGYASGSCPRFRPGAGDAVRFAIAPGPERTVNVRWLVESEGLPVLSGELPCSTLEDGAEACAAPALVLVQLRAYVAAYRAASRSSGKQSAA